MFVSALILAALTLVLLFIADVAIRIVGRGPKAARDARRSRDRLEHAHEASVDVVDLEPLYRASRRRDSRRTAAAARKAISAAQRAGRSTTDRRFAG